MSAAGLASCNGLAAPLRLNLSSHTPLPRSIETIMPALRFTVLLALGLLSICSTLRADHPAGEEAKKGDAAPAAKVEPAKTDSAKPDPAKPEQPATDKPAAAPADAAKKEPATPLPGHS